MVTNKIRISAYASGTSTHVLYAPGGFSLSEGYPDEITNTRGTFIESRTNGACPDTYTLQRTWTGRDRCGNSTTASQLVTVRDVTPPSLAGVPGPTTVDCNAVYVYLDPYEGSKIAVA